MGWVSLEFGKLRNLSLHRKLLTENICFSSEIIFGQLFWTFGDFFLVTLPVSPVWPDLAKFHNYGKILKLVAKFFRVNLVFGKILILLWHKCNGIGQVFIVVGGKYF